MISGRVNPVREAVIELEVLGLANPVEVVIDTGFSGALCLSRVSAAELGLSPVGAESVELGDGSVTEMNIYLVAVTWLGREMQVRAILSDSAQSVIGTELLRGCRLEVDFVDRTVRIVEKA